MVAHQPAGVDHQAAAERLAHRGVHRVHQRLGRRWRSFRDPRRRVSGSVADAPGKRAPLVLGYPTFHAVTDTVSRIVELGPGNVLSGLAKRILPGVTTVTLGTAAEVEQFMARP